MGVSAMQRVFAVAFLAFALAGCSTAQLDLDARWPTGVASARAEALRTARPCVIFTGIGSCYDHNIGRWQPAFLESVQADKVRSEAVLVAAGDHEDRDALGREFPFIRNLAGPYVLVLDAKGDLLAGFFVYSLPLRSRGEPSTEAFVAMLSTKITECLRRGFTIPDLARRVASSEIDVAAAQVLIDRYEECLDFPSLSTTCGALIDRTDLPSNLRETARQQKRYADAVLKP
jgi:hypothetical protein